MRSFLVCTAAVLMVTTVAATGSAEESAQIATRPRIELGPQVRVVGFHRPTGQTGMYTGGALGIAVDVENTGNQPVDGVVVKVASGAQIIETTISIPPHATRVATLSDADGLPSSCQPTPYKISLAGPGTGDVIKNARITPTCTFSTKLEQTWNLKSPDQVEAEKNGNAYLYSPTLQSGASCSSVPTLKVRIRNNSSLSSPSIIVQEKTWDAAAQVKAQTWSAFPLAIGEDKEVVLSKVWNAGGEPTTKLKVGITDWTKSLKGNTSDGGIFVVTTRSCSVAYALD